MARKNDGLLWHLMDAPWWVSVLFAAIAYMGLSYVLPALSMSSENFIFNSVAPNLPILAPYVAFTTLLIPAPVALFKQLSRQRQFATTTFEIASQGTTAALNKLSWLEFEGYIGEFFKQQGYEVKQAFSQKPDGGVDIWIRKDGQLTLVQCKHWKTRKVGIQILREMYAVMIEHNASKMIIVTSGDFTSEAIKYAHGKKRAEQRQSVLRLFFLSSMSVYQGCQFSVMGKGMLTSKDLSQNKLERDLPCVFYYPPLCLWPQ